MTSDTGQTTQITWPIQFIPESLAIGDPFHITISDKLEPRTEHKNGKSLEELRELLYDLIN